MTKPSFDAAKKLNIESRHSDLTDKKVTAPTKVKKTKGGDFPVFPKDSAPAMSYGKAFATARSNKEKTFDWKGKKYNTRQEGEGD